MKVKTEIIDDLNMSDFSRTEVVAMNIRTVKKLEMAIDKMQRRKLRGDFTMKYEYRTNRNMNERDIMRCDFVRQNSKQALQR